MCQKFQTKALLHPTPTKPNFIMALSSHANHQLIMHDTNQLDASFPSQIKTKVKPPNRGGIFHIFIYKSLQPPYLEYRILIHRASCWYKTFYLYCPSRVSLKYVIFAIPNSPWSFGLHIFLQLTSFDIPLIQFSHPQRKFLWNLSIFFSTFKGPLKKDI